MLKRTTIINFVHINLLLSICWHKKSDTSHYHICQFRTIPLDMSMTLLNIHLKRNKHMHVYYIITVTLFHLQRKHHCNFWWLQNCCLDGVMVKCSSCMLCPNSYQYWPAFNPQSGRTMCVSMASVNFEIYFLAGKRIWQCSRKKTSFASAVIAMPQQSFYHYYNYYY